MCMFLCNFVHLLTVSPFHFHFMGVQPTPNPTTEVPTTSPPTTAEPTTDTPTTAEPTTAEPTTAEPTTLRPTPIVITSSPTDKPVFTWKEVTDSPTPAEGSSSVPPTPFTWKQVTSEPTPSVPRTREPRTPPPAPESTYNPTLPNDLPDGEDTMPPTPSTDTGGTLPPTSLERPSSQSLAPTPSTKPPMTAFPTGCDERMVWHYDDNSGVCTNADMDVPGDTTYENVDECCADYMWSTDCDIVDVCAPTPSPSTGGLTDKPVFIWEGTPSPTVRKVPPEVGETPVPSPPPTLSDNEPTVRCSLSLSLSFFSIYFHCCESST